MKTQNINKIKKHTAFVYKSIKAQNNFSTDPTVQTAQTILNTI